MHDPRSDELLEESGRIASRSRLALAWSDGLEGAAAKACSRGGAAVWNKAKQVSTNEDTAAGIVKTRARRRNPCVVASASGILIVEVDLDVPEDAVPAQDEVDARIAALVSRLELPLPSTMTVRSRRGLHFYYRLPSGCAPAKVQISEAGDDVTWNTDGYTIGVPGLHELRGVVYRYVNDGPLAVVPAELHRRLHELGNESDARAWQALEDGEPIPIGRRNETLFHRALEQIRAGAKHQAILEDLLRVNREQCHPPLDEKLISKQLAGAAKWARTHPTDKERVRAKARRILDGEEQPSSRPGAGGTAKGRRKRALERRPLRNVLAQRVDFAIEQVVPLGTLSMVAGIGGLGKSALVLAYAKLITDHDGNVLIVSYEDAAAQVLRPRFEALGGDLDRLFELYVDVLDGSVSFPTDLAELDRHVRETSARAVLIDPVSASIDLKLDAHKDQDVRVVLGQLSKLAEREQLAVVMNAHLNKAPSADPYLRINGSTAFYNAARSVLTVTRDPSEPDWQRLVAHHKSNYGPLAPVERWRVVTKLVATAGGPIDVITMEFVEVAEGISRDDVLAPPTGGMEKLDGAIGFLEGALADGEWHDSAGLKLIAGARRIAKRTLERAAEELGLEHERRGFPSTTWWRLPQSRQPFSPEFGATRGDRVDTGAANDPNASRANDSGGNATGVKHRADSCSPASSWLARDGAWRCHECEPPVSPGEVIEAREA